MELFVFGNIKKDDINNIQGLVLIDNRYNYFNIDIDFSKKIYNNVNSSTYLKEEILEQIHKSIIGGKYTTMYKSNTKDDMLYNYIDSFLFRYRSMCKRDKVEKILLGSNELKVWLNSKGYIHILKRDILKTNIGYYFADIEFRFSKKKELKEVGYNLIEKINPTTNRGENINVQ